MTTIDLIAHNCGLSKKTIEKFYINKEKIICEIITNALAKTEQHIRMIPEISPNILSELMSFFQFMESNMYLLTPVLINEISDFYPNVYRLIRRSIDHKFLPFFIENIECGKFDGVYKKSINAMSTGSFYFQQLSFAFKDNSISLSERIQVLSHLNSFYLNNIVNEKGAKLLLIRQKN